MPRHPLCATGPDLKLNRERGCYSLHTHIANFKIWLVGLCLIWLYIFPCTFQMYKLPGLLPKYHASKSQLSFYLTWERLRPPNNKTQTVKGYSIVLTLSPVVWNQSAVSRKKDNKMTRYNTGQIVNQQLTLTKWGKEAHFQFFFLCPILLAQSSINVAIFCVIKTIFCEPFMTTTSK